MSNSAPSGDSSPSAVPASTASEDEDEATTTDTGASLILPDPKPDGTNPFRVIVWILFTAFVAARHLTHARKARLALLGREMRTEERDGVRVLHWEDDVDWRAVERELSRLIFFRWDKARSDARKLCAAHGIPFNVYDPLLKAASDHLEEIRSIIQGVAGKEVYPDHDINRRLYELADSTTPTSAPPASKKQAEGAKSKPKATTGEILPALLSASDIATRIGRLRSSVTSFLTRFAETHPDCRVETPSKRRNEPAYLYRTADVWPALEKWMKVYGDG
jgi:hypothetical protein